MGFQAHIKHSQHPLLNSMRIPFHFFTFNLIALQCIDAVLKVDKVALNSANAVVLLKTHFVCRTMSRHIAADEECIVKSREMLKNECELLQHSYNLVEEPLTN